MISLKGLIGFLGNGLRYPSPEKQACQKPLEDFPVVVFPQVDAQFLGIDLTSLKAVDIDLHVPGFQDAGLSTRRSIDAGHLFPKIYKRKEWSWDKKDISVPGQNVLGNNDLLLYLRSVVFNEISHGTRDFVESLAKLDFYRSVVFSGPPGPFDEDDLRLIQPRYYSVKNSLALLESLHGKNDTDMK